LRCTECRNKQLTVTFSKNPQSSTFERWFVLVSAIPRRTSRVYIYIFSSAPEKPNMRPGRSGLEFGRRTSLRETILSSHRTTPQAPRSRRLLRRRRAHDCHASRLSATKSRRLRAPSVLRKRLPTWSWWTMYHPHSQAKQAENNLICVPPLHWDSLTACVLR
jgi:hypothetical protein